jgi:hypothetical protein
MVIASLNERSLAGRLHMQRNFPALVGFVTLFCLMGAPIQSAELATPEFQTQTEAETFFGTILRNGDNFVLSDSATRSRYRLDNSRRNDSANRLNLTEFALPDLRQQPLLKRKQRLERLIQGGRIPARFTHITSRSTAQPSVLRIWRVSLLSGGILCTRRLHRGTGSKSRTLIIPKRSAGMNCSIIFGGKNKQVLKEVDKKYEHDSERFCDSNPVSKLYFVPKPMPKNSLWTPPSLTFLPLPSSRTVARCTATGSQTSRKVRPSSLSQPSKLRRTTRNSGSTSGRGG